MKLFHRQPLFLLTVLIALYRPDIHAWQCSCGQQNSDMARNCQNCSMLRPEAVDVENDPLAQFMRLGGQLTNQIKELGSRVPTGNCAFNERMVGMSLMLGLANNLRRVESERLPDNTIEVTRMGSFSLHEEHPVQGEFKTHTRLVLAALEQYKEKIKEFGKRVCCLEEVCCQGCGNAVDVVHITETQLLQAMMIAQTWVHLHGGDLVTAAAQTLGQFIANPVPLNIPELWAFTEQYDPLDIPPEYGAKEIIDHALAIMRSRGVNHITIQVKPGAYITIILGASDDTFTWIVAPHQGTGVNREQLIEVVKHMIKPSAV